MQRFKILEVLYSEWGVDLTNRHLGDAQQPVQKCG